MTKTNNDPIAKTNGIIGKTAVAGDAESAREAIFITWIEFLILFLRPMTINKIIKRTIEDETKMYNQNCCCESHCIIGTSLKGKLENDDFFKSKNDSKISIPCSQSYQSLIIALLLR